MPDTNQPAEVTEAAVLEALSHVNDPDLKKSLTSLGMIDNIRICGGDIGFDLVLTTTACPLKEMIKDDARKAVEAVPGVSSVSVQISGKTLSAKVPQREALPGIKNIVAVSSGKGGVGKSTVAVNLACAIAKQGGRVGILDADIYGPNVPLMMGLSEASIKTMDDNGKLIPPENHGVKVMSMAFLVKDDQPVVWRGPMLDKVIRQFLNDTSWGELDYLIVDLPPGTGDAQLTIIQATPVIGAVIVTTPQDVAVLDSRKGLAMFKNANVPVFGIVENMSYYQLPDGSQDYIFGKDGGKAAAEEIGVPFLGEVPILSRLGADAQDINSGTPITVANPASEQAKVLSSVADQVVAKICDMSFAPDEAQTKEPEQDLGHEHGPNCAHEHDHEQEHSHPVSV
ncbi:MAG: Mrp/NBP35 family ATP-binding protein [Vampirovibrio sp.]|nr:Mrp/NBP35 family ATP-binding protein [Vampirovibrio sp.]